MTVPKAIIVGAGPVGCYAAARLCQTRLVSEVHVYEKQEQVDLSRSVGRNVNITLCKRGLDALQLVDVRPEITLPARKLTHFTIYTANSHSRHRYHGDGLMSVKRHDIYKALQNKAVTLGAIFHFGVKFEGVLNSVDPGTITELEVLLSNKDSSRTSEKCSILIGSDGVYSSVRKTIFENIVSNKYKDGNSLYDVAVKYPESCVVQEHVLGYRELTIPKEDMQAFTTLEMDTFHIWQDSGLIVLGLPSADDTLTLGVYMEKHRLMQSSRSQIIQKISDIFPDLKKLPSLTLLEQEEFHGYGSLCSVLPPYLGDGAIVLLGDAAHAMLPFLGQGLNSGLEDVCLLLDSLERYQNQDGGNEKAIRDFSKHRIDDIHTIVRQSFNEGEKLQMIGGEQELSGVIGESSTQTKSFFDLISTTNMEYKKAWEMTSSPNKSIGLTVKEGETLAVYQSVKTVMTVQSPCDGVFTDVKTSVTGQPIYTVKPDKDAEQKDVQESQRLEPSSTGSGQFDKEAFNSLLKTKYVGREFTYLETTGSTMDDAKSAAQLGCPSGSAYMAETMTKGRGRQGKAWTAPPKGNIYITFVLRLPEKSSAVVQFAAALSVARAIQSEGLEPKVKWPNDIWVRGHKVSGILVEAETSASIERSLEGKETVKDDGSRLEDGQTAVFYLGIGINVNDDTRRNRGLRNMATSISSELLGVPVARERVLAKLCEELEVTLSKSMEDILSELEPYLLLKRSTEVKVKVKEEEEYTAVIESIDNLGRLHIQKTNSKEEVVLSDLMTSVRPSPVKVIYVYEGDGSSKQSVHMLYESLLAMCDLSKYNVKKITPEEVRQGSWTAMAALLAIGGGFDTGYIRALNTDGLEKIRDYVTTGGRYLGICAGAYLACQEIEFDKGGPLEVCGPRSLQFLPGKCVGPTFPGFVYNSEAGARAAEIRYTWNGRDAGANSSQTGFVYYNGGGHFELDCATCENVEVIAQLLNAPDGDVHTAAVKCQVGKGLAVLSGVHFEYLVEDLDKTDQHLKTVIPSLRDTVHERDRFYRSLIDTLGL